MMVSFLSFWIYSEYKIELKTQKRKVRYKTLEHVKQAISDELNITSRQDGVPNFDSLQDGVIISYTYDTLDEKGKELSRLKGAELDAALSTFETGLKNKLNVISKEVTISPFNILREIITQVVFAFILLSVSLFIAIALYKIFKRQREMSLERNYFVSSLTHELKTPISIISVALEAIQLYQKDPSKHMEYIQSSRDQIKKLNKSIDQILTYNDDSNLNIHFESIELNDLIKGVVADFDEIILNRKGTIHFESNIAALHYNIDRHHFQNMLYNIIDNSIKYNIGEPEIEISIVKDSSTINIGIADNGIGINKKDQQQVFNQFYRVNSGMRNGHGIGLYYVEKIVSLHKGSIALDSEPNVGSKFVLKFPFDEQR